MNATNGFIRYAAYPATVLLGFAILNTLGSAGLPSAIAAMLAVAVGLLIILMLERRIPFRTDWQPTLRELKTDAVFMLLVQVLLPRGLALALAMTLAVVAGSAEVIPGYLWPHDSPVWAQCLLMVLLADFLRYWLHVASHRVPWLWRFHAVHHETEKLYALNVARFHPVEKSMQYLFDALPFILLAVAPEVIAAYFVFYAINGFFQHANIDARLGVLNHIISGAELHRWHHHVDPRIARVNFGNNIIVWDTLFGTRYLPTDPAAGRLFAVGIRGHFNHYQFRRGIVRAWIAQHVIARASSAAFAVLLRLKMWFIRTRQWQPFVAAARNPAHAQQVILGKVLRHNRDTGFGRDHSFADIHSFDDFRRQVPLQSYESIEPYIQRQRDSGEPAAIADQPLLYAKTSGTTGAAKYIPVGPAALAQLKSSQSLAGYCNYRACPEAYQGKLLVITSAAIEGYLECGAPYGSASGLVVESMPRLARRRYLLPAEVFEIDDHEVRYREILKIALCERDISFIGTANPSTLIKLLDILNSERWELLEAISQGSDASAFTPRITKVLNRQTRAESGREHELRTLFGAHATLGFNDVWPGLKLVVTWTGGSCGIPIKLVRRAIAPDTQLMELGYVATECRGTITVAHGSEHRAGGPGQQLPCLQQNFFEFIERSDWETRGASGARFLLLHELEQGRQYYIIVTNFNGIYRYFMNDIVEVDGVFEATPTFRFIQKGRGVTNITGEKLSEQQVMAAVVACEERVQFQARFFLMLADEQRSRYQLLLEPASGSAPADATAAELSAHLEEALAEGNIEYRAKRASGRLGPVEVCLLQSGAGERYRRSLIDAGQRESQLKFLCLQYARDNSFDFGAYLRELARPTPLLTAVR